MRNDIPSVSPVLTQSQLVTSTDLDGVNGGLALDPFSLQGAPSLDPQFPAQFPFQYPDPMPRQSPFPDPQVPYGDPMPRQSPFDPPMPDPNDPRVGNLDMRFGDGASDFGSDGAIGGGNEGLDNYLE